MEMVDKIKNVDINESKKIWGKKRMPVPLFAMTGMLSMATLFIALCKRSRCRAQIYRELLAGDTIQIKNTRKKDKFNKANAENRQKKHILITGAGSYIGTAVEEWLNKDSEYYDIDTLDMRTDEWRKADFSLYDVIFHVAGIAHADVEKVSEEQKNLYYKVNTDLAIETAEKAKYEGVGQFIFMSSMIVYSGCKETTIKPDTIPKPLNFYGDSKWRADQKIQQMADEKFRTVILRPPMIYGKGSKGNYPELSRLAGNLPVFPEVNNKRSMLYIDNLCEFVKLMIDNDESGVFFPQNSEYTNTSKMVQMIAAVKNHNIIMIPGMSIPIKLLQKTPGRIGKLAEKAFGNLTYDMQMSEYKENYRVYTLLDSIKLTEEQ